MNFLEFKLEKLRNWKRDEQFWNSNWPMASHDWPSLVAQASSADLAKRRRAARSRGSHHVRCTRNGAATNVEWGDEAGGNGGAEHPWGKAFLPGKVGGGGAHLYDRSSMRLRGQSEAAAFLGVNSASVDGGGLQ
jgi:hypothetical protein